MENKSTYKIEYSEQFIELREHPYTGTGYPEALKGDLQGQWSRRITRKHRLIYEINENTITVYIISGMGHYGEK